MKLTITTFQGLEVVLAEEVRKLGGKDIEILNRAVQCSGDTDFLYRANLCLRTALRVLKPIHEFEAADEREYYSKIQEIDWKKLFAINQCFAIHSVVNSETFRHSRYMALKAKDAIVDQFRDHFGRRPNVSTYDPDLIVNVHINEQKCTVSIDSSGEPLHKRGYKVALHQAPLNEVLAAGLLLHSDFENYSSFHDPMCGSGTLISEALMIHTRVPAGYFRDEFAFMKWKDYDQVLWRKIKSDIKDEFREPSIEFSGADIDRRIMFGAKKNLIQLPYGDQVRFYRMDFLKEAGEPKPDFVIMNPPYDVRLETENIEQFYADIGTKMKHEYKGSRICVFTANLDALKKVGLKPSVKLNVLNGQLPSKLYCYDMYDGSLKNKSKPD